MLPYMYNESGLNITRRIEEVNELSYPRLMLNCVASFILLTNLATCNH